jgi:hypothetical protein
MTRYENTPEMRNVLIDIMDARFGQANTIFTVDEVNNYFKVLVRAITHSTLRRKHSQPYLNDVAKLLQK